MQQPEKQKDTTFPQRHHELSAKREAVTWPCNGKNKPRQPGPGADVDKPDVITAGGETGAVRSLQRGKHGEGVLHVARHDFGLVGDGGEVHPLTRNTGCQAFRA